MRPGDLQRVIFCGGFGTSMILYRWAKGPVEVFACCLAAWFLAYFMGRTDEAQQREWNKQQAARWLKAREFELRSKDEENEDG